MESISDPVNAEKDIQMKTVSTMMAAAVIAGSALMAQAAQAQAPVQMQGLKRTDILKSDFSVPGREVLQVRVDFAEGTVSPKHSHPGEEVAFVLEGTLEYQVEGRAPVTLKVGDAIFIPAGALHVAKNVGTGNAAELATYLVDKDKPLATIVK
jgi:quercetin dioxygenase-like cupin family protein